MSHRRMIYANHSSRMISFFSIFFFLLECRLLHLGLNDTHSFLTNRQVVVHHGGKRDHNDNNTWQNTVAVF